MCGQILWQEIPQTDYGVLLAPYYLNRAGELLLSIICDGMMII